VSTPVGAVNREFLELQQNVGQLTQGQKYIQTVITQDAAEEKTLMQLSLDSVNRLNGTMAAVQKSVQEMQSNSGARLETISTQFHSTSDNMQEMLARTGKLSQQLADSQDVLQEIDAKLAEGVAALPTNPKTAGHRARTNHLN
jgi:seryl-tRNA synthetase